MSLQSTDLGLNTTASNYFFVDSHDKKIYLTSSDDESDCVDEEDMPFGRLLLGVLLIGAASALMFKCHQMHQQNNTDDEDKKWILCILAVALMSAGVYVFLRSVAGYQNGREAKSNIFSKRPTSMNDFVYDPNEFGPFKIDNCTSLKPLSDDQTNCVDFYYSERRKALNLTDLQYSNVV